jgi:DNA replication ATP-dependent helicase Dna2
MAVANRFFYNGRLQAGVSPEERTPPDSHPVQFVPVTAGVADARSNLAEASAVSEMVRRYLAMPGIVPESIGVITPFRAQAAALRKMIGVPGVTVDTVERFQGGERDIMILSLVRAQSSEFVFDERRFNVAITRARRKLVVVAHPELFRNSSYEWLSRH